MARKTKIYRFQAGVWKYPGKGGWLFVSLPQVLSKSIRNDWKDSEQGWGRLKAQATIGKTCWQTAIWFDTKANAYLLPLKSTVRKQEGLKEGSRPKVVLEIEYEADIFQSWSKRVRSQQKKP
ncbi:MAG: DUF1905 domain-containing protein [Bdellovibrionales bacterium]|nr:DUF1905 domain-containing protein [Bdellovibrionales bacterium]